MRLDEVGQRIRELRRGKGLTLEALSSMSGLSKSFLSDIERGRCDVTLTSLQRIADALGVGLSDLFPPPEPVPPGPRVVRAALRTEFRISDRQHTIYSLLGANLPDKRLDPLVVRLLPGHERPAPYAHQGEEFGFVLEGHLVVIWGNQEFDLGPGDCIHMSSQVPHTWENRTTETTTALWVVTPPVFQPLMPVGVSTDGSAAGRVFA